MDDMKAELIASCGMNCRLCMAYQREKKQCKGCNGDNASKPYHCQKCAIKNCPVIQNSAVRLCYDCAKFPCRRLKQLDARYQAKYHMSMIANLETIRQYGMDKFLLQEEERWKCASCGGIVCVHRDTCPTCKSVKSVNM